MKLFVTSAVVIFQHNTNSAFKENVLNLLPPSPRPPNLLTPARIGAGGGGRQCKALQGGGLSNLDDEFLLEAVTHYTGITFKLPSEL